ncbi:hypothetical protein L6164_036564 [Bauhinia variegata]|uniref:Uncharacterized protein n=1 Tax=Bauhinia variegata TaxID=167791 RepID=A0ACB9KHE8_BAUVA|nr:hypothetical protein L6164_036564 [Bauhinia variegata]
MTSMKEEPLEEGKPQAKKARTESYVSASSVKPEVPERVVLNPADCDLDFNIGSVGLVGSALYEKGFAYCWSGARANVGITGGKYCFGCTIISEQPVDMEDTAPDQQHVCRLGISRGDNMVRNLGESEHSFGYGGTGKFSNGEKFLDYGQKFGIGDTVVCYFDLENKPLASIGFSKNGEWLGTAFLFNAGPLGLGVVDSPLKDLPWESALFPHVLLKNVVVRMQFSIEDGLVPQEGFKPWATAIEDRNFIMGPTCCDRRDCEVIMMVGLPASGKTTWAEKWVKEHPEKRYVLLGTNLILDQMKVPGLLRKNNYGERFDHLMDRATGIFNILISRAANTPRNYIIDQTNVYKSARKRKLKPFAGFQKIAVVTFPKPEELKRRSDKRFKEMGKEIPPDAVNAMLANFVLPKSKNMPGSDEFFDEVMYVELNRDESCKYLEQMKQDLASLSNNNSSMLPHGGCYRSLAGPPLQNQGSSLTGSGSHWQGSYSPIPPCNYRIPIQVNAASRETGLQGSLSSFSGVYPSNQNQHLPGAASSYGSYPNDQPSFLPRDSAAYCETYGAIPRGNVGPYSEVGGSYSGSNVEGNNNILPGAFPDPYRSGMNHPSPVANTRTEPFNYNVHGGPYPDIGGPQSNLLSSRMPTVSHTPRTTFYGTLAPYNGTPSSRPPLGNFPDNARYITQHPRYY